MGYNVSAREYLLSLSEKNKQIQKNLERIAELRITMSSLGGFDYSEDRIQTSGSKDRTSSVVAMLIDLERETEFLTNEYLIRRNGITCLLDRLESKKEHDVAYKIYVNQESYHVIAKEMNISERQVMRIHRKTLDNVEKIVENVKNH